MQYKSYWWVLPVTAVFFLSGAVSSAFAHKLIVTAWTEGPEAMVEGAFGDGSAASGSAVTVYGQDGAVLLKGKTDGEGFFSFPVPVKADLKIELDAGMGHVAQTVIPADEISAVAGEKTAAPSGEEKAQAAAVTDETTGQPAAEPVPATTVGTSLSKQDVQIIMDKSLKKQLRPVMEQLEARKFTDILAGIGYIFGLMGIATYFHFRRKSPTPS